MEGDRPALVGRVAPGFALEDQRREPVEVRPGDGRAWLLSFHPLAWTDACRAQMQSLEANRDVFGDLGARAVGISVDSWICKRAWSAAIGVEQTPLLADFWPHGAVARLFDLFREKDGFSDRANVIVDGRGRVVFVRVYPVHSIPPLEPVLAFLRSLG